MSTALSRTRQELTGAIRKGGQAQYLDKLQVERERGITVKARAHSAGRRPTLCCVLTLHDTHEVLRVNTCLERQGVGQCFEGRKACTVYMLPSAHSDRAMRPFQRLAAL